MIEARTGRPPAFDTVLRGRALLDGVFQDAEIGVRRGRIARIAAAGTGLVGERLIDVAADAVILPGLVDTHVHVNEPGRTEWEGFESATRAAAAGGVTTIVDMPLNSIPPTVSVAALDEKRAAAEGRAYIDVGFWGGVIPGNLPELEPLARSGVYGFKCFLLPSGVDEFPAVSVTEMRAAMAEIAGLDSMLVVHAEDAHVIDAAPHHGGPAYADFLASRPRGAEDAAIAAVIAGAATTGVRAHILHLSNADSLGRIAEARARGVRLSVETCPHYLTLTAEDIPPGATAFKCCPPIREHANRDELWQGLTDGIIDFVVSDHSPATPELKFAGAGDFAQAWGGIASLQLGLPLVWTEARRRGIPLERVIGWMSEAPAARVGLTDKGRIAVGCAADFAVFAPDEAFVVDAAGLEHRHPVSPYDGRELVGVVRATLLAGAVIDRTAPRGRLLRRGSAGSRMLLEEFNDAPRDTVIAALRPCADIPRWCDQLADRRPYGSLDELWTQALTAADPFTRAEIENALAQHPRIGERASGDSREATMSRSEQAGMERVDSAGQDALRAGNLAYEKRFGRVFLIRAAGRGAAEILASLQERLTHTPDEEERVVAAQLREIAVLRLQSTVTA